MVQCKVCSQILGGTELHCDKPECPCRGFHEMTTNIWETALTQTAVYEKKNYRSGWTV